MPEILGVLACKLQCLLKAFGCQAKGRVRKPYADGAHNFNFPPVEARAILE
jgi:hypothetical protein